MTRYYLLPLEAGEAVDEAGRPVNWAACPALPGAYEEATGADAARDRLAALACRIIAEHLVRDDPLGPEIAVSEDAPNTAQGHGPLVVAVGDADLAEVRATPLLVVEQPEP